MKKKKKTAWGGILMMLLYLLVGGFCGILIMRYLDAAELHGLGSYLLVFALMLAGMYLVMYLQIILHEGGHLFFGLLSGYGFSSFRVGSLMLQKTEEGLRFRRLSLAGTGGQCLMTPPELKDGAMPFVLYNLGGVLMNLVSALACFLLSLLWPGTIACLFLQMAAVIGLVFALANGLPLHLAEVDNDGSNIVSMRKSPAAVRAFWVQLKANELASRGVRLKDMPEEWFTLPDERELQNGITASVAVLREGRLTDMLRIDEADEAARALLEGDARLQGVYRSLLTCDRIFFALLRGEDPAAMLTKELKQFMKSMKSFPSVLRTEYALALHAGDTEKAAKLREHFEKVARSYPSPADIESERQLMALADERIGPTGAGI